MSEGIIIAIIGFSGTILGAVIGAFANIQVAKITASKSRNQARQNRFSFIAIAAGLGFICSVAFAITQLPDSKQGFSTDSQQQNTTQPSNVEIIDLGSGWKVSHSQETEKGSEIIYAHFPAGKVKYTSINPDDSLSKVYMVCASSRTNIFNEFLPKYGNSEAADYESNAINVPNDCHIEFTVHDLIGGQIGIEIELEPAP